MINVLQFADVINKADFIDTIIQNADPAEFRVDVCVRSEKSNIASPSFPTRSRYAFLPGNSRRDLVATSWWLSRLLKDWKIDILHAHHFEQAIVGYLATRICPSTRLVLGRHYSDSIYRNPNARKRRALLAVEQLINRASNRIIVPSQMIFEILTKRQGIRAEKIDIVHYGFDPKKYNSIDPQSVMIRRELGLEGKFIFSNFSRLHEEKGHRYLIDAVELLTKHLHGFIVLIVGEGPERQDLERRISKAGLHNYVKLLGWRTDAIGIMAESDVVVQSTLQEAFSQVMCEAMWMGKPLIMTDVSVAWLKSADSHKLRQEINFRLVECSENLGFGKANNLAMKETDSPFIFLLNPDTIVRKNSIDELLSALKSKNTIGVTVPKLLHEDGSLQPSVWASPTPVTIIFDSLLYRFVPPRLYQNWLYGPHWHYREERSVPLICAAAMMLKREVYDSVGGFDEDFHMYAEDFEYGKRIANSGWDLRFIPSAQIHHLYGQSSAQRWSSIGKQLTMEKGYILFQKKSLSRWLTVMNMCCRMAVFGLYLLYYMFDRTESQRYRKLIEVNFRGLFSDRI